MADIFWSKLDQNDVGEGVPSPMGYEIGGTKEDIPGPDGVKHQQKTNSPRLG